MFSNEEKQKEFLSKYQITPQKFNESCLTWETLDLIAESYIKSRSILEEIESTYLDVIKKFESIHSVRSRIKDPEHVCEKIIRNNYLEIKNKRSINTENYRYYIQDMVGIRILHLYKDDWIRIHEDIVSRFSPNIIDMFAYVRQGDDEELFSKRVRIKAHRPYRSVHYILKDHSGFGVEIQVRTLFEEAWGEIDHDLRYPYDVDNPMINQYMDILSLLMGIGNNMSSFIHGFIKQFQMYNFQPYKENDVLNRIMEVSESIDNKKVKEEIQSLVKNAKNYREQICVSEILKEFNEGIDE